MRDPNAVILYVDSPERSAEFYATLLGRGPVESSPNWAMFVLGNGSALGLWSTRDAQPAPLARGGGAEVTFTLANDAEVEALHGEWASRGIGIAQAPTRMDFGYTFVALDPDGHRLRAFAPAI